MNPVIELRARTKRGKQLLREHGSSWRVLREQDSVACFDGRPGMFVESTQNPGGATTRWIEPNGAPNFNIAEGP